MSKVSEKYVRIKNWLTSYDKFVIHEMDKEDDFHFSFGIWGNKSGETVFPLRVGYLKEQCNGKECLIIGFHWIFDKGHDRVVDSVVNDPTKTKKFVERLRKIINSKYYVLRFHSNDENIESISVTTFLDIDLLDEVSLLRWIRGIWYQYLNLLWQLDMASGRRELSNPSDHK